jgi:hypothetical protein
MRRIVISMAVAGLGAVAVLPAVAGTPSGQGAQKSSLGSTSGSMSNCSTSHGSNGWAILNDPGKVGSVAFTNGEVHLVGGAPNTTYLIALGSASGSSCMSTGNVLTTNGRGIGNGHINEKPAVTGNAFVALFYGTAEEFASSPVRLE